MKNRQCGFGYLYLLIAVVLVAIIATGWLVWKKSSDNSSNNNSSQLQSDASTGPSQEENQKNDSAAQNQPVVPAGYTLFTGSDDITFAYPESWTLNTLKDDEIASGAIANVVSPAQHKDFIHLVEIGKATEMLDTDLVVSVWDSINNEVAQGGTSNTYQNLDQYVSSDMPPKQKIGEVTINGIKAYEILIGGFGQSYGIIFEVKGKVFEFDFVNIYDKSSVTEEAKNIIQTIQVKE